MLAVKENKQYQITEEQWDDYLMQGYDILDDKGNILAYSPWRKVSYSDYEAVLRENEMLKGAKQAKKA